MHLLQSKDLWAARSYCCFITFTLILPSPLLHTSSILRLLRYHKQDYYQRSWTHDTNCDKSPAAIKNCQSKAHQQSTSMGAKTAKEHGDQSWKNVLWVRSSSASLWFNLLTAPSRQYYHVCVRTCAYTQSYAAIKKLSHYETEASRSTTFWAKELAQFRMLLRSWG